MNSSLSPHPGGRADGSIVVGTPSITTTPTDIQDINSSHSQSITDHNQQSLSSSAISSSSSPTTTITTTTTTTNQENHPRHDIHKRRYLKTEYKSNFTPFDQYVYNEITDTFVKQHQQPACGKINSSNLLIESRTTTRPLSASSSNQDLSSHVEQHHHQQQPGSISVVSPALDAGSFEPVNGSGEHHDATSEPWYMEVMKRNEKAHEYRFKSEIGHNSPLLKNGPSHEEIVRKSPLGNDPLTEAQIQEQQQLAAGTLDSISGGGKQTFRFSPQDYKRDHLISHMANNNNFKLPKETSNEPAGRAQTSRRVPLSNQSNATTTSRPLSRTTAASRARSQSSRRQVAGGASTGAAKTESSQQVKSSHTTPTKSVPSRVSTTTSRVSTRTSTTATTSSSVASRTAPRPTTARTTATRPAVGAPQDGAARSTTATRRPLASTTTARTTATRPPTSTTTRAAPVARTPVTRSPAPATARTTTRTAAPTTSAATKSPVKRNGASSTTTSSSARPSTARQAPAAPSSRYSTKPTPPKTPSSSVESSPTNAVKSIKTKALVDAGQKAAAATATTAAVGALVASSEAKPSEPEPEQVKRPEEHQQEVQSSPAKKIEDFVADSAQPTNLMSQEPDLIFTTTEAGNMLADEIAQAEKAASERASQHIERENIVQAAHEPEPVASEHVLEKRASSDVADANELVNGLAGGLVSTEDRYDSSERDGSLDYGAQQAGQTNIHGTPTNNDEEPYSIIPTTYGGDRLEQQQQQEQSKPEDKQQQGAEDEPQQQPSGASDISEPERKHDDLDIDDVAADEQLRNTHKRGSSVDLGHNNDYQGQQIAIAESHEPMIEEHNDVFGDERNKGALLTDDDDHDDRAEKVSSSGDNKETTTGEDEEPANKELHLDDSHSDTEIESQGQPNELIQKNLDKNLSREDLMEEETKTFAGEAESPQIYDDNSSTKAEEKQISPDDNLPEHVPTGDDVQVRIDETEKAHFTDDEDEREPSDHDEHQSKGERVEDHKESEVDAGSVATPALETEDNKKEELVDLVDDSHTDHVLDEQQATSEATSHDDATKEIADQDRDNELRASKGELLMNVADLMEIESMKKQEMSRKAEIAREQSNSRGSLNLIQQSEILLSADQLNEQFAQVSGDRTDATEKLQREPEQEPADVEKDEHDLNQEASELDHNSEAKSSDDLVNFGSITPTNEARENPPEYESDTQRFKTFEVEKEQPDNDQETELKSEPSHEMRNEGNPDDNALMGSKGSELGELNPEASFPRDSSKPSSSTQATGGNAYDDDHSDEEQQKLSNHLTNSDDDVILEPRNKRASLSEEFSASTNISPSRYNEGAGLGLMTQEERIDEHGTVELADGSSAEIVAPTVAENRVEVATSKSMVPELAQTTAFIHPPPTNQEDDYDSEDLDLNPDADPINVAATMSPSSSVAEQMLRLSRQASNGGQDPMLVDDSDKHTSSQNAQDPQKTHEDEEPAKEEVNLLGSSTASLASDKDSAAAAAALDSSLAKGTAESQDASRQTFVVDDNLMDAPAHAVETINNNELDSGRKQSIDRKGDFGSAMQMQSRDARELVEGSAGERADDIGGMKNGNTKDEGPDVTVPTN